MGLGRGLRNAQYTSARCAFITLAAFEALQSVRSGGVKFDPTRGVKFDPTIWWGSGAFFLAMFNIRLQGAL